MIWAHPVSREADNVLKLLSIVLLLMSIAYLQFRKNCTNIREDIKASLKYPKFFGVKGIKYLRVVDGSVMPTVPSGNTNAPIIMIAEKASEMIKNDNPDRKKCFEGDDMRLKRSRWNKK
ncbi:hypothetical protein AVEN_235540-1 [Araneus ventricosus]|uniref:Glucose-methanol-choline oxidoreductase C-terminal domain-containing protein n=1 Tax=Araneus ventricosus TaxID=182803 RepID=A0A4Y2UCQ2_ARAVE|nr:hypothetical protein AVEN_43324-1 [Araneus ventricosus]GBO10805.1 hypothetical protein AVEN_235540-1 [Araneus ventricosus]